jgi:hypothetical protein
VILYDDYYCNKTLENFVITNSDNEIVAHFQILEDSKYIAHVVPKFKGLNIEKVILDYIKDILEENKNSYKINE